MINRPITFQEIGWDWRDYQLDFLQDTSQYIAVLKSRQIGFSEALAFLPTQVAITSRSNVYYVSTNLNQSKDLIRKALKWLRVTALLNPLLEPYIAIKSESATKIELVTGMIIEALPCKPSSVRGKTGYIILDEVDHIHDIWNLYEAIAPAVSTSPDLKLIACSTPFGEDNFLYRVFHKKFGNKWSKHQVDVHEAIRQGHPKSVLDDKSGYDDDSWMQEFECAFIGDSDRYFSNELLKLCSSLEPKQLNKSSFGIDIGRSRDRSAFVLVSGENHSYQLDQFHMLPKNLPHPEQLPIFLKAIEDAKPTSIIIDGIGEGSSTADSLKAKYTNVTKHRSTAQYYDEYIPALKAAMESGKVYIPNNDLVYAAFSKIKKEMTSNGPKYIATRDAKGHADIFYAFLYAFSQVYQKPPQKGNHFKALGGSKTSQRRSKYI